MTARYRTMNPGAVLGHRIDASFVRDLLDQEGCFGLRMYHALDASNQPTLVMVGTDENGDDMLDLVMDKMFPCPRLCSKPNVLNG